MKVSYGINTWACTCLYASLVPTARLTLWYHFSSLSLNIHEPWLMIGDFNEIISTGDVRGCNFHSNRVDAMLRMMENCNMVDLPTSGGKFTWHSNCRGHRQVAKKIDCGIANVSWRLHFLKSYNELLCSSRSDHNPLLLRFGAIPQVHGTWPFRFEAAWITHPNYLQIVQKLGVKTQVELLLGTTCPTQNKKNKNSHIEELTIIPLFFFKKSCKSLSFPLAHVFGSHLPSSSLLRSKELKQSFFSPLSRESPSTFPRFRHQCYIIVSCRRW